MNLNLKQVKSIIEGAGHDFSEFKQETINEIQLDIINKKGIFNDLVNDVMSNKAEEILIAQINVPKKEKNESQGSMYNQKLENSKGEI